MKSQAGISLPEILTVIVILGLALGMAAMYLEAAEAPLDVGASILEGEFRQARLKAIATTSAYRVSASAPHRLIAERGASCSSTTWNQDSQMNLILPDGVTMTDTSWLVCFSSRGISTNNVTVPLTHPKYGSITVEVLLGGTTRVVE